ncbi:MAG: hypothetical protein A2V96_01130 [Candidatus Yonathbacteria bacterium RBG_16_43_6]|uniref:Uncharacterized protein n=1 Tax=Candidatus Yonathbacteria bacterium RIFCSPLOWO2_01_FULL_43_27 TaxID=1802726 RepID=A0A1G2SC85_9BACT|nr:MAG: hypothetical protein A2658_01600 [Candidatus Yonathbacteria bacterium RIFCSPHIGHO2_01_FULL_44_19]OHA79740.1 MAG: hypothetical protein A2V96_01130 [Candidatus Yonathbacteria bacterium RBG_16_43_6]OHA82647.1 MAG: hypothetical protein A3B07_01800 [Candidatus Yonathbacteria bacterium RIFCSPLOWO2_01_FULL_43_27]
MEKHEKAPQFIGVPQFAELAACVLKQLPRDIDPNIAQGWIKNPKALGKALQNALCPPPPSVLERVRASGYLDVSFDGEEVHPLAIRSLTKEQALDEYRKSGGRTWIWDELGENMPYSVPEPRGLNVMILSFGRDIGSDEAFVEMDKLDVRPLTYEELVQYGILYPKHQKKKILVGLGTIHILHALFGSPHAPVLNADDDARNLDASSLKLTFHDRHSFLVVPK